MNDNIIISYDENSNNLTTKIDFLSENLNYPLTVYFTSKNNIIWNTSIEISNTWCLLPNSRGLDVRIIDVNGDIIFNKPWSLNSKSDICEIEFIKWCQDFYFNYGYKPNGVVIGSHNGSTGEWVESYKQNLIGNTLLIEPNVIPFNQLVSTYQHDTKFKFKNVVVSESNDFVNFYTDKNSESESSSLILNNLLKNTEQYLSQKIKSVNPNTLFINFTPDWLHIDAEGYDAKILLLINENYLDKLKFIIWEHIHLDDEVKIKLKEKLELFNFTVTVGLDYNTFAIKNNNECCC
jgi:FkbM family methyltransferase